MWIDLGDVANLAEVTLNGKPLGIAWKAPYRVDATGALKAGDNVLEVRVVDLWVNRLIGDQQPDAKVKYTFTTRDPYEASSPLVPAGVDGAGEDFERGGGCAVRVGPEKRTSAAKAAHQVRAHMARLKPCP